MRTLSAVSLIVFALSAAAQTTYELTNVDETFVPDLITMQAGDSVHLVLGSPHTCTQVDEATWNANDNTSNGGFDYPSGDTTFSLDAEGTYYYVCIPHASMGMKGRFIVTPASGVKELAGNADMQLLPNPANTGVHLMGVKAGRQVHVLDMNGRTALKTTSGTNGFLDVSTLEVGTYLISIKDEMGRTIACKRLVIAR